MERGCGEFDIPESLNSRRQGNDGSPFVRQDWVNRQYMRKPEEFSQAKTFKKGLEFISANHQADSWFLQIETFDPHEPFYSPQQFKDLYPHDYRGPHFDWPSYSRVTESEKTVEHVRYEYAALLSMCDAHLGKVLDLMDAYDMWQDTMLIVNTDHGFLLGEHGWWAKCVMPFYNEVAHTPLFIWDPRCECNDETRQALVQTIDLVPTLLDFFDVPIPDDMQGLPLRDTLQSDAPVREAGLFGLFGGHVNCTDGRYVYMRAPIQPENQPLYEYTLMPTQHGAHRAFVECDRLTDIEVVEPFGFTKQCRVMKIRAKDNDTAHPFGTLLFDLDNDPGQEQPIRDPDVEQTMTAKMVTLMKANDAPADSV